MTYTDQLRNAGLYEPMMDLKHDEMERKMEWKSIDTAPKDGTTIWANYGTPESPVDVCLICWSPKPVCMLGLRNGSFPLGWATAIESDTDLNLPMDSPAYWKEYY